MRYIFITYLSLLLILLTACSTDNAAQSLVPEFPKDEEWKEEIIDGASVTIKGFKPGDNVTRTSLYYDGQNMVFGWKGGDIFGLYPTAKDATHFQEEQMQGLLDNTDYPHPSGSSNIYRVDPACSVQSKFISEESTSQTTRITNGSGEFFWDEIVRWTAYLPYSNGKEEENYEKRYFSFKNQKQSALTEVGEYFDYEDATDETTRNLHLNNYHLSEIQASQHLGSYDVMISPETQWVDGVRINFQMRHIGAIARIYLKAIEENLVIKDIKLICDKAIFYEEGSFNLISHPYDATASNDNYGVNLTSSAQGCQIKPEGEPVKMIQLSFTDNCVTKKSGNNWGPYVVAYFMMYPITYNPATDGNLFAYVTAYKKGSDPAKEVHYISAPLSGKTLESGYYYQWTSSTHPQDGLYPIELTATLQPWQDIVGAGIETDLTK